MTRYYGNTPTEVKDRDGNVTGWKILTKLPGTDPKHACDNEDELFLAVEKHEPPRLVGPGCYPTLQRYVIEEIEQKQYDATAKRSKSK